MNYFRQSPKSDFKQFLTNWSFMVTHSCLHSLHSNIILDWIYFDYQQSFVTVLGKCGNTFTVIANLRQLNIYYTMSCYFFCLKRVVHVKGIYNSRHFIRSIMSQAAGYVLVLAESETWSKIRINNFRSVSQLIRSY